MRKPIHWSTSSRPSSRGAWWIYLAVQAPSWTQSPVVRRRYERGHWDAVIIKYKETELVDEDLSESTQSVLLNVRQHLEANHTGPVTWLSSHAIDLHADGELNAHVDSVRFSGGIVAGLSLLSPSIMRLRPEQPEGAQAEDKGHVDLLLPVRSLYVLSAVSRYRYTHELLPNGSVFRGSPVERGHRLSIIFRDALRE